ncbi:uncharacterized protein LOC127739782 isoform X2 [Arachis duranensis]|uniref:Uncharacterized protein LOC127739782 isoform X2 n=1 Tax=Arachis duranensis TaxID=130453 RepID=A0A9C6T4D9_ARADU|nr:uncharacterized protein LOC127739782 isoform X2 [Arachis duranensis]
MPGTTSWPPRPPLEPLLFSSVFLLSCELLRLLRKWIGIEVVAAEVTDREEGVLTRCIAFGFQRVEETDDEAYEEFYCILFIRCYYFSYY